MLSMLFVEINERKKKQIEEAMSDEQSNQLV
jgi:hypothetical protein